MGLAIGLMSGTSMDGIDAALCDNETDQLIAGITRPYSDEARRILHTVLQGESLQLKTLPQLNTLIGREFGLAVQQLLSHSDCRTQDIKVIGSHGQTIAHDATAVIPYTIQLGCPHTIAEMTGITVVADFRTRDLVVGGQGAPFAPLFHDRLFRQAHVVAVVNIGGIANITLLEPGQPARGYDTGPGNTLMDAWISQQLGKAYDTSGMWAGRGRVIEPLLSVLLSDPFFSRVSPKSIGKEYFSLDWLHQVLDAAYAAEDIQATLLELTVRTIAAAVRAQHCKPSEVVICGGGVHNATLMKSLQRSLSPIPVHSSALHGIDPDYIEAMMFAWLAEQAIQRQATDCKALTGAKKPAVLGAIYPTNGEQLSSPLNCIF